MKNAHLGSRRTVTMAVLGVLLFVQFGAQAQEAAGASDNPWFSDRIEGTWNVSVDITICASGATITSFDAMAMFAANGSFHDTNATNPALRSPGFGYWRHLRRNQYEFAFRFFLFDETGVNIGSQVVRHDAVLSADRTTYSSEGTAELYDPFGNLLVSGCSNSTATRFQ